MRFGKEIQQFLAGPRERISNVDGVSKAHADAACEQLAQHSASVPADDLEAIITCSKKIDLLRVAYMNLYSNFRKIEGTCSSLHHATRCLHGFES